MLSSILDDPLTAMRGPLSVFICLAVVLSADVRSVDPLVVCFLWVLPVVCPLSVVCELCCLEDRF